MFDLNTLSEIAQVMGEGGSLIAAIGGGYWHWVIKPNREFKKNVLSGIATLHEEHAQGIQDVKDFKANSMREQENFKKDILREVDDIKKDQDSMISDLKDRFNKVDAKNEKLLDLIIKYFSEKD